MSARESGLTSGVGIIVSGRRFWNKAQLSGSTKSRQVTVCCKSVLASLQQCKVQTWATAADSKNLLLALVPVVVLVLGTTFGRVTMAIGVGSLLRPRGHGQSLVFFPQPHGRDLGRERIKTFGALAFSTARRCSNQIVPAAQSASSGLKGGSASTAAVVAFPTMVRAAWHRKEWDLQRAQRTFETQESLLKSLPLTELRAIPQKNITVQGVFFNAWASGCSRRSSLLVVSSPE
eukprot:1047546-Rhodomonas_salina.1